MNPVFAGAERFAPGVYEVPAGQDAGRRANGGMDRCMPCAMCNADMNTSHSGVCNVCCTVLYEAGSKETPGMGGFLHPMNQMYQTIPLGGSVRYVINASHHRTGGQCVNAHGPRRWQWRACRFQCATGTRSR